MTVINRSRLAVTLLLVSFFGLCLRNLSAQTRLIPEPIQEKRPITVPRLIQYTGMLTDRAGRPLSGVQGVTFFFYQEQTDAAPLWMETQNVTADSQGRFTVLLGATQPQGLALDMFTSGQVHWLGIKASNEDEQPRILLASVPYALVATRTETPSTPLLAGPQATGSITTQANPNKPAFAQTSIEITDTVGPTLVIDATSGPPLQVNSTDKVPNLNVDMLNGFHDTDLAKIAGGNALTGTQMVSTGAPGNRGVIIQGANGQAADLQEWQALGGAVLASVGSTGIFTGNGSGLTNLNASNVTSGLLAPAQGGTGLASPCPSGQVLKGGTGAWTCGADNNSGGTVTSIATGNGLSGGPVTTTGTISLQTCPDTQVLKSVAGTWTCGIPAVGTITGISVGAGLTGGGAAGSVSLTLDPSVVPSLISANSFTAPLQVTAGTGNSMLPAATTRPQLPRTGLRRTAVTPGPNLAAVTGTQTDTTGITYGVFGKDSSPSGYGGAFQNLDSGGNSLTAFDSNDNPSFNVSGSGEVTIGGATGSKLNLKTRATFTATGTVSGTAGSPTLTGTGTKFLSEIHPGDEIEIPGVGLPGFGIGVASVQSDTSLTASAFPSSFSGSTATVLPNILNISDPSGNLKFDIFGDGLFAIGNPGMPGQRVTVFGQESTANGFDGALTLFNGAPGGGALWNLRTGATGTNTPAGGFSISSGLGNYRLVIDNTGRVGIGTTAPAHKLEVNGDINAITNLCIAGVCKSSWPAVNPGTVTSVATGTGLTGGPITSTGTIAFDTTFGDGRYARLGAANIFTTGQSISSGNLALGAGNLSIPITTGPSVGVITLAGTSLLQHFNGNLSLGLNAGNFSTTAIGNVAIGTQALSSNTTGGGNTAVGQNALSKNTTGPSGTAVGSGALQNNTTGGGNVAYGALALALNTTGSLNTAVGTLALNSNSTATGNTAVGNTALRFNTTGFSNTSLGQASLTANTTGNLNTAVGQGALTSNTTASGNTALGQFALNANTTGSTNTAAGTAALQFNTTGVNNVALGSNAVNSNQTGNYNTGLGTQALQLHTTGDGNTAVGQGALQSDVTSERNTAVGYGALANSLASDNTAIGQYAMNANLTGAGNTAVGVATGGFGSPVNTTGSFNTFIGYKAGPGTSSEIDNATAIGANALVSQSNTIVLGSGVENVGIGTQNPTARLQVANGEIYLSNPGSRIILKSAGGTCARLNIDDTGKANTTVIPCP